MKKKRVNLIYCVTIIPNFIIILTYYPVLHDSWTRTSHFQNIEILQVYHQLLAPLGEG